MLGLTTYILDELRRVLPWLAHRHGCGSNDIDDLIDALSIQHEGGCDPSLVGCGGRLVVCGPSGSRGRFTFKLMETRRPTLRGWGNPGRS